MTSAELGALAFTTQDSGAWYDNTFFFEESMIIFMWILLWEMTAFSSLSNG